MPGSKHTLSTDFDNTDLFGGTGGIMPVVPDTLKSMRSRRPQERTSRQARKKQLNQIERSREHRLALDQHMKLARLMGMSGNQAVMSANRAAAALTGINSLDLMGISYAKAPQNEVLLTPTDIGKKLGGLSAKRVNELLCVLGLQTTGRDHKGCVYYEPTAAGLEAGGVMQDTGKKHGTGVPIRQLRWASGVAGLVMGGMATGAA